MIIICDRDFICCWSLEAGPVKFAEMFAKVSIVSSCEVLIEDCAKLYVSCIKDLLGFWLRSGAVYLSDGFCVHEFGWRLDCVEARISV